MKKFDSTKWITENKYGKLNEEEVFSDEELDYIGDMMTAMYEKLGLDKGQGETDVVKALALSDRIEGFFQSLK
jgi:hypothetical protein